MTNRKKPFVEGEYYHIYNRGVEKRDIFLDFKDYSRFLVLLFICNSDKPVYLRDIFRKNKNKELSFADLKDFDKGNDLAEIISYCLMPNHFHLILREKTEGGISKFMQKLLTGYTMYFNEKYKRSGVLFQGTFKSRHIDDDAYFNYIFLYVLLNPIGLIEPRWKEGVILNENYTKKFIKDYQYSSYLDHRGIERLESCILTKDDIPKFLGNPTDFEKVLDEWISIGKEF